MQGMDVLAPQKRRKAASISFVKETHLCGMEGRKHLVGVKHMLTSAVSSFMFTDTRLWFGRVHLKAPLPIALSIVYQKEEHSIIFFR